MSSTTKGGGLGAADLLFRPLGRWRAELVWRFLGLVIFQIAVMGASLTVTLPDYFAIPWPFFAHLSSGLLLLLFGPRVVTFLYVAAANLAYLLLGVLSHPSYQLAEEYLVLISLPTTAALLVVVTARSRPEDFDAAVDRALIALVRWTGVVVLFFAAFHKLNADFFEPSVSCGADLIRWFYAVLLGRPAIPEVVARIAPVLAVLGEAAIPVLLILAPRVGILFTLAVMGTIGHGNTTGFTSLVICFATSFLRHADGAVLAPALRRRWPLFLVAVLLVSHLSSRVYSGIRWFEYQLFEAILLGIGLCVVELLLADARALRDAAPASRGAKLRARLRPGADVADLLPGPRVVNALLVAFAVLGFANGFTPYFGLKERMSFAMFSNLRVDDDRWNHYLMPRFLDLRKSDGFVRVVDVRPAGVWEWQREEIGRGLYTAVGLRRRLAALAEAGDSVEITIAYGGWRETFPNAARNGALYHFLDGLPPTRFFREALTLGTPQTCVH